MRKRRILFCSEASFLTTGYANYTRRVLNALYKTGKYELAELGAFGQANDPKGMSLPWRYFGVSPNVDFEPIATKEQLDIYQGNIYNSFGAAAFEPACLEFKPDIVFDIRDYWMTSFIDESPFRKYFKFVLMPTVDAYPQARQWIDMYKRTDAILSYSEWGGEVLLKQSGGNINYYGTASPSVDSVFRPKDKDMARSHLMLNLGPDTKIIGTVMRNQRRKLFPDLFEAFKNFLLGVENSQNYYLYCHTGFPDMGWDIPELLQEHGIASKVLFTYKCYSSGKIFSSFYAGPKTISPFTNKYTAQLCGIKNSVSLEELATIQYANSEGFGIPLVEAAACGVKIAAIDYSAMTSIIKNLKGIPIPYNSLYKELETGCLRAVPNNSAASNIMLHFFSEYNKINNKLEFAQNNAKIYHEMYSEEKTVNTLMKCFDDIPIHDERKTWLSKPKTFESQPPFKELKNLPPKDLARWLIINVLGDINKINTFFESRLIRDLSYGYRTNTVNSMYINESSAAFDGKKQISKFTIEEAYTELKKINDKRNYWERLRVSK
jgi:glycosyltransferase involved in cell wall biosynthesis